MGNDNLIRSWDEPDDVVEFGGVTERVITLAGMKVVQSVQPVGWSWRTHFQPLVGGDWCMDRHVGVTLSGRQAIGLPDGTVVEYGPGDLYDVPPGHEGWTVAEDDCVMLEWVVDPQPEQHDRGPPARLRARGSKGPTRPEASGTETLEHVDFLAGSGWINRVSSPTQHSNAGTDRRAGTAGSHTVSQPGRSPRAPS